MLPVLAAAEQELAGEAVVVVGVHSPKFPTEADPELVRQAVRRHGITHPVVVDVARRIWSEYGIRAWPTLVFVRPDGTIFGAASGEPDREPLLTVIRGLLDEQAGLLVGTALPLRPEPAPRGSLAYPSGIAIGPAAVAVADTDHHQLVICDPDGTERLRVGDGRPGLRDGSLGEARLGRPHGLAFAPDGTLVVADTGNHAVRAVDLRRGTVTTLAGTGRRSPTLAGSGPALRTDLRSPWDVAVGWGGSGAGSTLVAMAGSHQLWAVEQPDPAVPGVAAIFAGSGREARVDGDSVTAAFAQPSGLAWGTDGDLYVADSETSAIRRVRIDGQVETVAGGDLFAFGDTDGTGDDVRLQHPVGIAAAAGGALDGLLLVADTLNHKVKTLDPMRGEVRTLFGNGQPFDAALAVLERRPAVPGDARSAAFTSEPETLAWDGRHVLVVDTGNHRVLAVDPGTGAATVWLGHTGSDQA